MVNRLEQLLYMAYWKVLGKEADYISRGAAKQRYKKVVFI